MIVHLCILYCVQTTCETIINMTYNMRRILSQSLRVIIKQFILEIEENTQKVINITTTFVLEF